MIKAERLVLSLLIGVGLILLLQIRKLIHMTQVTNSSSSLDCTGVASASKGVFPAKTAGYIVPRNNIVTVLDQIRDRRRAERARKESEVAFIPPEKQCSCINCIQDKLCGRVWNGTQYSLDLNEEDIYKKEIHIVVSHCHIGLEFIKDFTAKFTNIASIHVISKCGYPVEGVPEMATIETLPNVGRCDHSYAYYITTILERKLKAVQRKPDQREEDAIVLFLKDNLSGEGLTQPGRWNSLEDMLKTVSSENGFACGMIPSLYYNRYYMSAYAKFAALKKYSIEKYKSREKYDADNTEFASKFANLGAFFESLQSKVEPKDVVQLCYGGVFAVKVEHIRKRPAQVWKTIESTLSRGNNIVEGHYVERLWATLLATPLEEYQMKAIIDYTHGNFEKGHGPWPLVGAMVNDVRYRPDGDDDWLASLDL